ncbi:WD40 repeat-like protein [Stipitochalara longipes BDJ]|nr:WD40 repeat-like protein [Stipitochalara longipes BDJ]
MADKTSSRPSFMRKLFRSGKSDQEKLKKANDSDSQVGRSVASPSTTSTLSTPNLKKSPNVESKDAITSHSQQSIAPLPPDDPPSAPEASPPRGSDTPADTTAIDPMPPIQPEQLWDQAYDDLKRDNPKLFDYYETIVSRELSDGSTDAEGNLANVGENIGVAINIVLSVKDAIGSALQPVPVAALAWTGLCVALNVLSNTITETAANRDGIIQVIRKMKWYSALSKLLLEESSSQDDHFTENSLGDVVSAENSVRAVSGDYGTRQTSMYLGGIFNLQLSAAENEIMQKLCVTDMRAEMDSLEHRKDHLLADSYKWILETQQYESFVDWHHSNTKRLLWIRGGPGKGKTMLLVGIIRELTAQQDTHFEAPRLSYFFCQDSDARLSTATSVLRGLIWMLVQQEKSLLCHLQTLFGNLGSKLFEDYNAFENLKVVFQNMLEAKALKKAYLVVDALDECKDAKPGRSELLNLISTISAKNSKVKWLVSSRDVPDIARNLKENNARTVIFLEAPSITDFLSRAVNAYTKVKMSDLAERFIGDIEEEFDTGENFAMAQGIRDALEKAAEALRLRADGTFLGRNLAAASLDGEIRIWDIESKVLLTLNTGDSELSAVAFSHDGRYIASGGINKVVQIWDIETSLLRKTLRGHSGSIITVAFSQDGQRLASGSNDRIVRIWNLEMGEVQQTSDYIGQEANAIAFSHDGHYLVSAGADKELMLWDVKTSTLHKTFKGHTESISLMVFSHDGHWLAGRSRDKVLIWNAVTGELLHILRATGAISLALSHDGRWLASALHREVLIWDLKTGELQQSIRSWLNDKLDMLESVAISFDGNLIALAVQWAVYIWDVELGFMLRTSFKGHTHLVNQIAFSSNERWLVTSSVDETVKIWDLESGVLQQTLKVGEVLNELSFGAQDSCLFTNTGSVILDMSLSNAPRDPTWFGCCLKPKADWVTWDGRNLLWLPSEYRSWWVAVRGSTIAISCGSNSGESSSKLLPAFGIDHISSPLKSLSESSLCDFQYSGPLQ